MCKYLKKISFASILIFSLVTNSGCIPLLLGAAAGAGGVAYVRGNLEKNFDEPVAKVHKATLAALKNLKLFIRSDELNQHSARIKAEFGNGKKAQIDIEALTELTSKIKIRVGVFGDETKSQMILNAIEKKM